MTVCVKECVLLCAYKSNSGLQVYLRHTGYKDGAVAALQNRNSPKLLLQREHTWIPFLHIQTQCCSGSLPVREQGILILSQTHALLSAAFYPQILAYFSEKTH